MSNSSGFMGCQPQDVRRKLRRSGIAIGGLLLFYQLVQGLRALPTNGMPALSPLVLLLAAGLIVFSFAQQMVSWGILMQGLGAAIPWRGLIRGYSLSFLPRYIPGTLWGYLSRSEWLLQDYGISYTLSSIGSFLEIAIALLSSSAVGAIYLYTHVAATARIGIVLTLGVMVIAPWIILGQVSRRPWVAQPLLRRVGLTTPPKLRLLPWIISLLLITLNMLLYGAGLFLSYHALAFRAIPFSLFNLITFAAIFSAAWVAGFIVFFLPSGLGMREITMSTLLSLSFGVPIDQASLLSILFRLVVTLAELMWIGIGVSFHGLE